MYKTIDEYLKELKIKLKGCDKALIQDALSDAEEFITNYIDASDNNNDQYEDILNEAISEFGESDDVVENYQKIDKYLTVNDSDGEIIDQRVWYMKFLMIIGDSKAWGALLYMLLSIITGIFYFTWVTTGLSLSVSLLVLIIGIPIAGLYLLSIRGIALLEGRLVDALLGVRMPRRSMFINKSKNLFVRLKELVSSGITWKAQIYMLVHMALGILYFTFVVTFLVIALAFIFAPVLELIFHLPMDIEGVNEYTNRWLLFLLPFAGALLFLCTLHIAKIVGKLQGAFARIMLVHI